MEVVILSFDLDPFVAGSLTVLLEIIDLAADLLPDLLQHLAALAVEEVVIIADLRQALCQRAVILRVILFAAFLKDLVVIDDAF